MKYSIAAGLIRPKTDASDRIARALERIADVLDAAFEPEYGAFRMRKGDD